MIDDERSIALKILRHVLCIRVWSIPSQLHHSILFRTHQANRWKDRLNNDNIDSRSDIIGFVLIVSQFHSCIKRKLGTVANIHDEIEVEVNAFAWLQIHTVINRSTHLSVSKELHGIALSHVRSQVLHCSHSSSQFIGIELRRSAQLDVHVVGFLHDVAYHVQSHHVFLIRKTREQCGFTCLNIHLIEGSAIAVTFARMVLSIVHRSHPVHFSCSPVANSRLHRALDAMSHITHIGEFAGFLVESAKLTVVRGRSIANGINLTIWMGCQSTELSGKRTLADASHCHRCKVE